MTEQDQMLADQWGTADYAATAYDSTTASSGMPWYAQTLDFIVKAAAVDRYSPKPVQQTGQYQLDQYGNLVPMGSPIRVTGQTSINNNLMMYAVLALGAVFLVSMMKD